MEIMENIWKYNHGHMENRKNHQIPRFCMSHFFKGQTQISKIDLMFENSGKKTNNTKAKGLCGSKS